MSSTHRCADAAAVDLCLAARAAAAAAALTADSGKENKQEWRGEHFQRLGLY